MYRHRPIIVGIGHHPQAQLAGLHREPLRCLPHAEPPRREACPTRSPPEVEGC